MAEIAKYLDAEKAYQYIKASPLIPSNAKGAVFEDLRSSAACEADLQPVAHGRWIEDLYGFMRCSECGMEWDEPEHPETNYCFNCGAKMDGEPDEA